MKNWLYLIVLFIVSCETYIPEMDYMEIEANDTCSCECNAFPNEGLVAYYPFNGNTLDESGNENHPIYDSSIFS